MVHFNSFTLIIVSIPLLSLLPRHRISAQSTAAQDDYLSRHNQARAAVGVEPLKWSEKLANASSLLVRYQRDKKNCSFANLTNPKYGANQEMASGQVPPPRAVVDNWVKEKEFYNHSSNSCLPGHEQCGVYTQVVWRKSVEVGCAQGVCGKALVSLTICFYDPPGNVVGESPY